MPGGDRGDGGKGENGKDFVVEVSEGEGISDVKKSTEETSLKEDDYATGDESYEIGSVVERGPATTRPSLSTGLRNKVIPSGHRDLGVSKKKSTKTTVSPLGTKSVGGSVIPDRASKQAFLDRLRSKNASGQSQVDSVKNTEDERSDSARAQEERPPSNIFGLEKGDNRQIKDLIDSFIIESKPKPEFNLGRTGSNGRYELTLYFKENMAMPKKDSKPPIVGTLSSVLVSLTIRLEELGYQKKSNQK